MKIKLLINILNQSIIAKCYVKGLHISKLHSDDLAFFSRMLARQTIMIQHYFNFDTVVYTNLKATLMDGNDILLK